MMHGKPIPDVVKFSWPIHYSMVEVNRKQIYHATYVGSVRR